VKTTRLCEDERKRFVGSLPYAGDQAASDESSLGRLVQQKIMNAESDFWRNANLQIGFSMRG